MLNRDHMLQDAPFALLAGGVYQCDSTWNKPSSGIDQCYKFYCPVSGQARLKLESQDFLLQPNRAYLIPGYRLVNQECQHRMGLYWIHFVPKSPDMMMSLSHMKKVYQWDRNALKYWRTTWKDVQRLFEDMSQVAQLGSTKLPRQKDIQRLFEDGYRGLFYRTQAMLLDIVSQFLDHYDASHAFAVNPAFEQLKPAIAFMDRHGLENPRLADIAKVVHLAPNYFHRKFTSVFHVTPFNYMLNRRLNLGRQLLLNTDLTLQHVAKRCGFYSEFHFSKTFKKHYSLSPKQFRAKAMP